MSILNLTTTPEQDIKDNYLNAFEEQEQNSLI